MQSPTGFGLALVLSLKIQFMSGPIGPEHQELHHLHRSHHFRHAGRGGSSVSLCRVPPRSISTNNFGAASSTPSVNVYSPGSFRLLLLESISFSESHFSWVLCTFRCSLCSHTRLYGPNYSVIAYSNHIVQKLFSFAAAFSNITLDL